MLFKITGLVVIGIKEKAYLLWYVFGRTDNKLSSELFHFSLGNIIKLFFCAATEVRIYNLLQLSEAWRRRWSVWLFGGVERSVSSICKSCDSVTLTYISPKGGWVGMVVDMFKSIFCSLCSECGMTCCPRVTPPVCLILHAIFQGGTGQNPGLMADL